MAKTTIEWTDFSVNPIRARDKRTGAVGHYCVKIAPECKHCYASRLQPRFKMPQFQDQIKAVRNNDIEIFLDESKLQEVLARKKPTKWFWCDMTDMFGDWVQVEMIDKCFATMFLTPHHTHQILTKRPARAKEYLSDPYLYQRLHEVIKGMMGYDNPKRPAVNSSDLPLKNVWLIVSAGIQDTLDKFVPILLDTPAAVRGVSIEPLLQPTSFRWAKWHNYHPEGWRERGESQGHLDGMKGIHWVIVGGESGPNARPMHPDWVRSLRDQCNAAGVPFFFKQWGEWAPDETRPAGPSAVPGNMCKVITPGMPDYYAAVGMDGRTMTKLVNVGKKAAGRILDGRTWEEYPA